jgi:Tol biopolymer transport system component
MRHPFSRRVHLPLAVTAAVAVAALLAAARPAGATYPGANGKIAFSSDFAPNPQIFTVNPDGSDETQVTKSEDGPATNPGFSPDGTKIIFQGLDAAGDWQLYEMNAGGTGRTLLFGDPGADNLAPKISPDGTKVAWARCPQKINCAIEVASLSDVAGTMQQLTSLTWSSGQPVWSPDGTEIAFSSNMDGLLSAVWVMNASDGANKRRLTAPALEAGAPNWSPDGKHIIFGDLCCLFGTNIWVMNADGSGQKQITHFPTKHQGAIGAYSPDGKKIVLVADLAYRDNCCNDLYTMDTNGTHMTKIVNDQPAAFSSDWGRQP